MDYSNLTPRQFKIINIITNSSGPVTCDALSRTLGYSRRTIQNDISSINSEDELITSTNLGYTINPDKLGNLSLLKFENEEKLTHILLKNLIMNEKGVTVSALADKLFISLSTLENQLKSLQPVLEKYNLTLQREKGVISVEGNEYSKRTLIASLIQEESDSSFKSIEEIGQYFEQLNFARIKNIIDQAIDDYGYYIEGNYAFNLYLNIIISLYRMKSDLYITSLPKNAIDRKSAEYKIAQCICDRYASHWNIRPAEEDIIYISILIAGQIKPLGLQNDNLIVRSVLSPDFMSRIENILSETFNFFMVNVNYSNALFNFAMHVDAMIKRIRNNQLISNEILDNLKTNCPFVFEMSIFLCNRISEEFNIEIPDSEIGFIAVHVGFLANAVDDEIDKINVLLACYDYYNIARNIYDGIQEHFGNYINISILNNTNPVINDSIDLIISTRPLNIIGKKIIVVSPLYTTADRLEVFHVINEVLTTKILINKNRTLSSYFHESLFFKTDDYADKESAIRFLCSKAIAFGLAGEGYTEEVLERERLCSTCFLETFAIPHSMNFLNSKTMFTVLISEKGIQWDSALIHIVLLISVAENDRKDFKKIYDGIIQTLWDKNKLPSLIQSEKLIEFIDKLL